MAIRNPFFKRDSRPPDVLTYDVLPDRFIVQALFVLRDILGDGRQEMFAENFSASCWLRACDAYNRERGTLTGSANTMGTPFGYFEWLLRHDSTATTEHRIGLIELAVQEADTTVRARWRDLERERYYDHSEAEAEIKVHVDEGIVELNHRFLDNGLGYQYEAGRIVRIDSTYLHADIVKPALALLTDKRFANAEVEFVRAHGAYREQRYSDCLNEAAKAFETTMKIICHEMKWPYQQSDVASTLIKILIDNGLMPTWAQEQLNAVKMTLTSGTPTTRNKNSSHGQGVQTIIVTEQLAAFGLHATAANINLLVAQFKVLKAAR